MALPKIWRTSRTAPRGILSVGDAHEKANFCQGSCIRRCPDSPVSAPCGCGSGSSAGRQPERQRQFSGCGSGACTGRITRLSAKSAVLLDASTGRVLYASHAEDKSLIASTTKIMTALVICEAGDLDRTVVIPPEAVGIEGSSMYLKAGEVLSMHELLYGLMLRSGNDAAVALALADSGSISAFAMRMNEKAAVLGLKNTHYANPHGLDSEENYSTALDLARLTRFALQNPDFGRSSSRRNPSPLATAS